MVLILTVRGRKLRAGMANKKGDDIWKRRNPPREPNSGRQAKTQDQGGKKKKKKKKVLTSGISGRKVFEIGACRVRPPDVSCERTQIGVSERGSALEARF